MREKMNFGQLLVIILFSASIGATLGLGIAVNKNVKAIAAKINAYLEATTRSGEAMLEVVKRTRAFEATGFEADVTEDGRSALELAADAVVYVNVRAGRQYELSIERKYETGSLGTTVWYRGKTIHEYLTRELNISNYKMQLDAIAPGKWHKSVASTFLYQDNKSRQISYGNRKLLPHTQMAFIQFTVRNGKAWISGIRFEDITDRGSLKVKTGGIERLESKK